MSENHCRNNALRAFVCDLVVAVMVAMIITTAANYMYGMVVSFATAVAFVCLIIWYIYVSLR